MKQKLLTILSLLVLCVTGAWAEDFTISPLNGSYLSPGNIVKVTYTGDLKTSSTQIQTTDKSKSGSFIITATAPNTYIKSVTFTDVNKGTNKAAIIEKTSGNGSLTNSSGNYTYTGEEGDGNLTISVEATSSGAAKIGSVSIVVSNGTANNIVTMSNFSKSDNVITAGNIKCNGDDVSAPITIESSAWTVNSSYNISAPSSNDTKTITITATSGKVLKYIAFLDSNCRLALAETSSTGGTIDGASWTSSSTPTTSVTFKNGISTSLTITKIFVITEALIPTLTGAWKVGGETVTSGTIYQGDAVPSLSLSVDASDDSHPAAGKYNVVYSKEGDDVVEITNEGAGFTLKNNVTGTATLKATITATGDDYKDATGTINYEYKVNPKTPTLNLDKEEVTLKSTPLARNAQTTVTLTGTFLAGVSGTVSTDGTTGLSISPEVFTISEGTVAETEFTITYNSDSGNSGDATITFTDGNINKELTVHYTSVIPYEWTTVSGATTWDWEGLTSASIELSKTTTPKNTDEFVLKNVEVYNDYTIAGFAGDAQQLKVIAQYPFRNEGNNGKMLQGDKIQFHTTVPGYVKVTYSNTGGKDNPSNDSERRPYRYVKVNDTMSKEGSASTTKKTTEAFFVPAGDVAITGYIPDANDPYSRSGDNVGAAMLRIYKVEFTEADAITVTPAGLATYASDYNLDFSGVTGIKAYKASISEKAITFTKMDEVPVGEGMLIRAMSDLDETTTFYVPHKASASPIDNAMKRGENKAVAYNQDGFYNYVLSGGSNGVGFYQANGETVPTDRAYLQSTAALAKGFVINYDDEEGEETDGIKAVSTKVENGVRYNLAGQKVGADYKGIVIVNGKKIVRK